jgi:Protein of unknown function (DUF3592)
MELVWGDEPPIQAASAEDIVRAVERQPRGEDFSLLLSADGDSDDFMDVLLADDGTFEVECEEKGVYVRSVSTVDEALLKTLLLSFFNGDGQWRTSCKWETPVRAATAPSFLQSSKVLWIPAILVPLVLVLLFMRRGEWLVVLFALAFPGLIAFATVRKLGEVKRAATWTKGSARIVKSELATVKRNDREGKVPAIEYEFSVGFHPFRGTRVSIGEIMPDTPEVQEALARYPVGGSATVYYDPANPKENVLERDLPANFGLIWVFIAVLAVVCVGGVVWFIGPEQLFHR